MKRGSFQSSDLVIETRILASRGFQRFGILNTFGKLHDEASFFLLATVARIVASASSFRSASVF